MDDRRVRSLLQEEEAYDSSQMAPDTIDLGPPYDAVEVEVSPSNATVTVAEDTTLYQALIVQYASLALVVVLSVLFLIVLVVCARLARDTRPHPVLGLLTGTRLLLCSLAFLCSVVHILRLPLSTFAYGFGEPKDVVSGLVLNFGDIKIPPSTETLLCRIFLTSTSALPLPLFLLLVWNLLAFPFRDLPKRPNASVLLRSLIMALPFALVTLVVVWLEPLLNTFARPGYLEDTALPGWVYKVTAKDGECPAEASALYSQNSTVPVDELCTYCVYPVTVTAVSTCFVVTYLVLLVVFFQRSARVVKNSSLELRLRVVLLVFTAAIPLLLCCQAVSPIPSFSMVAAQVVWIANYALTAVVLGAGVGVLALWQMLDASAAIKHKALA